MPVAYMPRTKQITLLQMDGDITLDDATKLIKLAIKKCEEIYEIQKQALKKRWMG